MISLVAQDKIDAALAKDFSGIDAERKQVLLQSARNAIGRGTGAELHENFSKNLEGGDLAFYNAITVVHHEKHEAEHAAPQPPPATESPEAAANAHSEASSAAESQAARARAK